MRRTISIWVFLHILLLSSCKKDSPVSVSSPEFLLPLKVGNRAMLKTSGFDTTGSELWSLNDTIVVFADTIIGSDHWFLTTFVNYAFANKSDGVWQTRYDLGGFYGTPTLIFKYPAGEGDQWDVHPDTSSWSLVSKSASIQVPVGVHTCHLYRLAALLFDFREDYYIKPGLGIVAIKLYSKTVSGREYLAQSSELVAYTLL